MMLDKLREGAQGKVAKVILGLIILSFALAGVGSYLNGPARTAPATVNGNDISAPALENAYRNERARMESQMGEAFNQLAANPDYMKQFRRGVLDRLIDQALIDDKARSLGLRVSDEQIKQAIVAMPEFAENGKFSNDRYLQLIRRAGMTPEMFRDSLRQDMVRQQLMGAVLGSEFALKGEAEQLDRLYNQTRDLRLIRLAASAYVDGIEVSDAEVEQFYKANSARFMNDETVKVDYLLLDAANLGKNIKVTEQDAQDYYDQHQDLFQRPERRQVAHILIPFGKDEKAAEQKAEAVLAKAKAGDDFAALAKADSSDTFSAKKGGELDWFEKGVMDPAFEKAAFALAKAGDLSAVVKSPFGFHIIKLLGVEPAKTKPFVDVMSDTIARLQSEKAKEQFFAEQQKMADSSFENPDSLDLTAEAMGLQVQSTGYFSQADAPAPLNDPKVLSVAFSEQLRDDNTNSDVIELADGKALVLHIMGHQPKAAKPLAEVKEQVITAIKHDKASEVARGKAQGLLDKLKAGQNVQADLTALGLKVDTHTGVSRFAQEMDQNLVTQAFRMPHPTDGKPSVELVTEANGDRVVVALDKVNVIKEPSQMVSLLQGQLGQGKAQADYKSLIDELRKAAKIEYFTDVEATVE
ncbi:peptidylprolyl isomerase [Aeromonas caviae]|jgi:peptidyl-prolyl cis-trans isomerase D|uniref:peptidylprolyl isomerase n=1 Tax=Aeromonas TaxID=642 RepID=UPI0002197D0A|nr:MULTISPECIES: peptidylprolyl isomerase [Aeromonas]KEP91530.1 peptidylprolyl isomerase [Aeromonas caviae]KMY35594.1 peptidylprolyl isomerase [Aeromonas caviae]KOG92126.1 peptidylprolyl isomerase [Aeromonas caviae]MBL0501078.1 peptidylprolyl isomerase [Aeromonas caviae]MBL0538376.1 peptidylprolyl isomerase [Aeromonas caviae]